MPPTSCTPVRAISQAPALIHSARVWNFPSARLRADHRNIKICGEPSIRTHRELVHRLFVPVIAELLQLLAQPQRVAAAVAVIGVQHQRHVRSDGLAHGGAGLHVHFRIGREGNRLHPGMQLDRLVATADAPLGEARIILRRGEAACHFVAAHRAAIGGHLVAIGADQLVDGHAQLAAREVPQRHLDNRQRAVGQLAGAAALPVRKLLPEPFAMERILAKQNDLDETLDQMRTNNLDGAEAVAFAAVIGGDGQQGLASLGAGRRDGCGRRCPSPGASCDEISRVFTSTIFIARKPPRFAEPGLCRVDPLLGRLSCDTIPQWT